MTYHEKFESLLHKGGIVQVIDNESGEVEYEEVVV
jgi:hypothetical protein